MTDFESALSSAIKNNPITKENTIHLKCLFHFSQMIAKQLRRNGLFKKKMNKTCIEIIRNLEILTFIEKKTISKYEAIILKELSSIKSLGKFIGYVKNYIFKIINNGYNYDTIITKLVQ